LYPLHVAILALFVGWDLLRAARRIVAPTLDPVALFGTPHDAPGTILANLLLVQSLHLYDFLSWNLASWSISTEFYTYAVFALCLIGLRKRAWIAALIAMIGGPVLIAMLSDRNMDASYDWGIVRCVYGFAAGAIAWNVLRQWKGTLRKWLSGSLAEC